MSSPILVALIGATATIVATSITLLVQARRQRKKALKGRKVKVGRITDPGAPDVAVALRLFERCIPSEERDSPDDIVRWLVEVQGETREGICKLSDFFLVAHVGDRLAGFAYLQFYPSFSLGYFSYLVIDTDISEARECHVSTALLQNAHRLLFKGKLDCKGIILEVDEPAVLDGKDKARAAARIRHFQTLSRQLGFPLKTVSLGYLQPCLSIDANSEGYPMRLMYAVRDPSTEPSRITKKEMIQILRFLSDAIYGDHFAHRVDWDQKYRSYLASWREKLVQGIGEVVDLT
jgi:hypothetical protein